MRHVSYLICQRLKSQKCDKVVTEYGFVELEEGADEYY
jgi:hypothetical protein